MSGHTPSVRAWFPKPYADFVQRLRVLFGFLLLIAFAWLAIPSYRSILIGLPFCLAGLIIRAWAAGHLAKNEELTTSGPFAYVRNPLYAGTLIAAAGIVIACRSIALAGIFAFVFVFVYLPVVELEEQHLRNIFPCFDAYARRVHRFLPLSKWAGHERAFSWALYAKNEEYKALLGLLVALGWLIWRCGSLADGIPPNPG